VAKYFSPVDLLRSTALAFEPRKLLVSLALSVPVMVAARLLFHLGATTERGGVRALLDLAGWGVLVFGAALTFTALAYVTRRQLEGGFPWLPELVAYVRAHLILALLYPAFVLAPCVGALGILWLLGLLRNAGYTIAAVLKFAYFVPLFFALVAASGVLLFQLGSMYVPSAAAIEGQGPSAAWGTLWRHVRHQGRRVVLQWLVVTVAVGVVALVSLGLAMGALALPNAVFPDPPLQRALDIARAWSGHQGVFAVYQGLMLGVGAALPVSLFATLGTLSYVALRLPAAASVTPAPMDETDEEETGEHPKAE
jgi:hypothetical protein